MDHRDIVLTVPIRTKVERSCHTWPRNIFTKLATLRSISPRSFANLLIIRPVGLVWKNIIGALRTECSIESCNLLAARRLEMISQKEFPSVTATWIHQRGEQAFKLYYNYRLIFFICFRIDVTLNSKTDGKGEDKHFPFTYLRRTWPNERRA